jgi:TATA-binding protein-associated factor Taf7
MMRPTPEDGVSVDTPSAAQQHQRTIYQQDRHHPHAGGGRVGKRRCATPEAMDEVSATSATTTTTASTTSRKTRAGCGEKNSATLEKLNRLVEDEAGAAQRADPRRKRKTTTKRQRTEKPVKAQKKQVKNENEDGDGVEEEQEDEDEEEEIGHSLHLSGGGNGGDGGRKKRQKRAKNVLNFISYVPPAPAPSRKKNLHTAPRLLAW